MKTFQTRLFSEKDIAEVIQINWTCLPENYDSSFFMDIYKQFSRTFLVATINEKVVGYIMCRVEVGFSDVKKFKITKRGHVISLAVLSNYRNQGIANSLLSKALKNIEEYGASECYLEVRVSNKSAIDIYQKLGFNTCRTVRAYYRDGEDAYVMSKLLGD